MEFFVIVFDYRDFELKDTWQIYNIDISIDDETNSLSNFSSTKKLNAKADDIICIKQYGKILYWGIIKEVNSEGEKETYRYSTSYITNLFDLVVPVHENMQKENIEDGVYQIHSSVDTQKVIDIYGASKEDGANAQLWGENNTVAQKFRILQENDYKRIKNINSDKSLDIKNGIFADETNVEQYTDNTSNAQKWDVIYKGNAIYGIRANANTNYYLDVSNASPEEGTNIQIFTDNNTNAQRFYLKRLYEYIIKDEGIEDFIAKMIEMNFIESDDTFINKEYIEIRLKSHTKLDISVDNDNGLFNLHTFMTNCTQLYNIVYTFYVENKKLIIEIEKKALEKQLIDTNAFSISDYNEVFETNVVSKVIVLTDTEKYELYLKNDRTTTTNKDDSDRAEGVTKIIYTQNFENAPQEALNQITGNLYNHNITFKYDKLIKMGTPIAIKTKKSLIYDTYISSIKITENKFYEYTCGNIRIDFISKIRKERIK